MGDDAPLARRIAAPTPTSITTTTVSLERRRAGGHYPWRSGYGWGEGNLLVLIFILRAGPSTLEIMLALPDSGCGRLEAIRETFPRTSSRDAIYRSSELCGGY
jgi:hypothetical protein